MSASDTVKEVVRIASTAGISKDIIDLMEKKLLLLTSEVTDLTGKNAVLTSKVSQLEIENHQLRTQIKNPKEGALQENLGVLWKRTANGFEPNPYCKECTHHPVMVEIAEFWVCSNNHMAPRSAGPPDA